MHTYLPPPPPHAHTTTQSDDPPSRSALPIRPPDPPSLSALPIHLHPCAQVIEVGKGAMDKHIVIFALRDLEVGEELQYDYQFALGGAKITCHCGAPNCWGRMN